jgi:hypothetical protein
MYGRLAAIAGAIGLGERYCQYLLQLLKLDDEALALADRYNLTEFQLRPIAGENSSRERQIHLVRLIAEYDLPNREIASLVKESDLEKAEAHLAARRAGDRTGEPRAARPPERVALDRIRELHNYLHRLVAAGTSPGKSLAQYLVRDPEHARQVLSEIEAVQDFMEELRKELDYITSQPVGRP